MSEHYEINRDTGVFFRQPVLNESGKTNQIKSGSDSWFGKKITIIDGSENEYILDKGSLIDFLKTTDEGHGLRKGFFGFFRSSDRDVKTAFYKYQVHVMKPEAKHVKFENKSVQAHRSNLAQPNPSVKASNATKLTSNAQRTVNKTFTNTLSKTSANTLASPAKSTSTYVLDSKAIDQNRKTPYSYVEVLEVAKKAFNNFPDEVYMDAIGTLESKLGRKDYERIIAEGYSPKLYEENDVYVRLPNKAIKTDSTQDRELQTKRAVLDFIDLLPGVDKTPYREIKINEGEPIPLNEVMAKASKQFFDNQDKDAILEKIKNKLASCEYERSLRRGTPPYINSDGYSSSFYNMLLPNEIEIDIAVAKFINGLPGVDVAKYVGHRLK